MRSSQAQRLLSSLLGSSSGRAPATWGTLFSTGPASALARGGVSASPPAAATACTACSRGLSTQRLLSAWPAQLAGLSSRGSAAELARWGAAAPLGSRGLQTSAQLRQEFISLNNLQDNEGARRWAKRVGRGVGSGKGKTAGRGHKGQKARTGRSAKLGFEGGQTPLRLRVPKRGFNNPAMITWSPINLESIQRFVTAGRLDPAARITMKDLRDCGAAGKRVRNGFKLLAKGSEKLTTPLHLEVSQASARARAAVEAAGGSVTTVYYNKLGLQALLKPSWFVQKGRLLPRAARPPPKLEGRFDVIGSLPPEKGLPARARSG